MISSTLKMAAALPMSPTLAVFSRRCGVSEMRDAGTAIMIFFLYILSLPYLEWVSACVQLKC